MNPSSVFDMLCAITVVALTFHYARKGFVGSVVQLAGNLFSILAARGVALWAAPGLFETFMAQGFRNRVEETVMAESAVDLSLLAEKYAGFLPESFRQSIVESFEQSVTTVLQQNAQAWADAIVTNVLEPLLTPVVAIVLFFILFALCRMVLSLLTTVLGLVNRIPVVGTVNKWLGWVVGLLAAEADIYVMLCIIWAVMVVTGGNISWLNEAALEDSLFYQIFSVFNPIF